MPSHLVGLCQGKGRGPYHGVAAMACRRGGPTPTPLKVFLCSVNELGESSTNLNKYDHIHLINQSLLIPQVGPY